MSLFNDEDPLADKKFVDISIPLDYPEARMRFREAHRDEETGLDDKFDSARATLEARQKAAAEKEQARQNREDAKQKRAEEKAKKAAERELRAAGAAPRAPAPPVPAQGAGLPPVAPCTLPVV